ncbi:MAG: FAD binding domain-containing protein [Deltaproteobacteria bacterium]|jgi:xanthine dehydrogenase YagS FAD-binding subunit|nr:FAD binding domain-containing protein [Deltaproteobacteria bacterium]
MLPTFSYVRPDKLEQAVKHLATERAAIHAGGTDLLGCLRERIIDSRLLVSLSGIRTLSGIKETAGGGLRIGALTTISELSENKLVRDKYPGLARGAAEVASPQLRNQGTLGGNLCQKPRCWYYRGEFHCLRKGGNRCFALKGENQFHAFFGHDYICAITHPSDTAPVLVALDADVHVLGPGGKRPIAVADLHVLPADDVLADTVLKQAEIITHITIPAPARHLYTSYRKVRARRSWDFALAGAALALVMDGSRVSRAKVVLSGCAPVPWPSIAAEQVLTGRSLTPEIMAMAAQAAVAAAKPLAGNEYKIAMFRGMLEEELQKAGQGGSR